MNAPCRVARPFAKELGSTSHRTRAEIAPDGIRDSTRYDPAGNVTWHRTRRGDVLTMEYDVLNRLAQRITPERIENAEPIPGGGQFPRFGTSVVIPADTASFTYLNATSALLTARNGDARITRTYYPNSAVQSEVQQIRTYAGANFDAHVASLGYGYDLDGRRTRLDRDPTDHVTYGYAPETGLLQTVSSAYGTVAQYDYDVAGRK